MRRRLVILAKYFPPDQGGMETYVKELAESLQYDFEVHVLAHAKGAHGSEEQVGDYRLVRCATWFNSLSQPFSPTMLTQLVRLSPDIIHLNAPNAFATLCWATAGRRAQLLITHHADVLGRRVAKMIYRPLYETAVRKAEKIIVFSRKNAATSVDLKNADHKLVEIPQGLNPAQFVLDEATLIEARALRRGLAGDAPLALFIGRLIQYKGLEVLLRAMQRLPGAHAAIAGDGPMREELATQIARMGLSDRVHLLGSVEERAKLHLLHAADMFVLPSISNAEAFGIVQVEAQMCALPIVASNLPTGVSDVTVDGETGMLVPPGDDAALANAMREIFENKPSAAQMGAAGKARALARFSSDAFARANREVFGRVVT